MAQKWSGDYLTRLLQGVGIGAVGAMIIGFAGGFWTLQSNADKRVAAAVEQTQVAIYTPVCVQRYAAAGADMHAKFVAESTWDRSDVIEHAGFATPSDSKEPLSAVANECADLITQKIKDAATKAKEASKKS
jgi:hypothetical protein